MRFRDSEPVESWYRLMRPPQPADWFDGINVSIHGIKPQMVANEPHFGVLWPEMRDFIANDLLVAHNAGFDVGVLRRALWHEEMDWPQLATLCSMRVARRTLDLLSYSLPWVADALGVEFGNHHDAAADAMACGQVLVRLGEKIGVTCCDDFGSVVRMPTMRWLIDHPDGPPPSNGSHRPVVPGVNAEADPEHPLFGRHITFTGGLDSMTRQEAWNLLATVGGVPEPSMTKRTNILVIGPDFYQGQVLSGDLLTGKMAKAAALRAKGQDIEVMSEAEFLRSI